MRYISHSSLSRLFILESIQVYFEIADIFNEYNITSYRFTNSGRSRSTPFSSASRTGWIASTTA